MSKDYEPLMKVTEDQVEVFLDPVDAKNFIRRIRKVKFFIHYNISLVTELNESNEQIRGYDHSSTLSASARQVQEILNDFVRFNKIKADNGQDTGKISVTRLGSCVFIG